jgi:phage terminase large subunit
VVRSAAPVRRAKVQAAEVLGFFFEPLGKYRWRVAYGGRGGVKSWTIARALLLHGASKKLRILCAREWQSSIADSVHRLLSDQVDQLGLQGFYEVQKAAIIGANGTRFIFKGIRRDIGEIKSTEGIDICWVEEAEAVSKNSWLVLAPTIRKKGSEIWVSFNPALESDATYEKFVTQKPARSIVRKTGWEDNPWLPAELAEEERELRRLDPEAHANVWGGEPWTRSDAQVFGDKWQEEEFEPGPDWGTPLFGGDWGFSQDPSSFLKLWVFARRLWIEYQEGGVKLSMDETARRIERLPGAKEAVIRADSARPETINEMVLRKLHVIGAPKWDGSVKDGIEHIRSYERIIIHPRCRLALQEARLYRYKTDPRTGDILPALVDKHNHTWDAVRYALAPLIRRRMRPQLLIGGE